MSGRAPRIFLSYRRDDARHVAGRLADRLRERFELFVDVETVQPGADFTAAIYEAVGASDVLLALIGPEWASLRDETGRRRIDDPLDWVTNEILAALDRGLIVIPVLIDDARMPRTAELPPQLTELATRQAAHLRHESFSDDVDRLAITIRLAAEHRDELRRKQVTVRRESAVTPGREEGIHGDRAARRKGFPFAVAIVAAFLVAGSALAVALMHGPQTPEQAVGQLNQSTLKPTGSTETLSVSETPNPHPPVPGTHSFGQAATFPHYTITVRSVHIDSDQGLLVAVKVCINKNADTGADGTLRARWDPWSVATRTGGTIRPRVRNHAHHPSKMFPPDGQYRPGKCISGRIPFAEVRDQKKAAAVVYSNLFGEKATWIP